MSLAPELADFIRRMPKAELHVHLEGSIRAETLLELAARRGVNLPADDVDGLERWLEFRDFDHFLEVYLTISRCLRDPEDFQLATRDFLEDQAAQNIRYTEAHFTISTHVANGANADEVAHALAETISQAEHELDVHLRWIPDIVRNMEHSRADQTLEWALGNRDRFVVALGLAGKEDWPARPFAAHFEAAAAEGLHRAVHAGEQTGAGAVREALEICCAERIGHGIRSVEDPSLLETLRERRVPLEISPTSNISLGLVPDLEEHPVRQIHRHGLAWSLASDDPALFHTSLTREFELIAQLLELDRDQIARLAMAGFEYAFLAPGERASLAAEAANWFQDHGAPVNSSG